MKMGEIVSPSPALSNLSIGSTIQCKILHVSSEMIVATYETEEKKNLSRSPFIHTVVSL